LAQQNGVLIDGAESRGTTESGNAYSIPVQAVAEFKLETSTYDAEYGRSAGGVAILATKSGANAIHASSQPFACGSRKVHGVVGREDRESRKDGTDLGWCGAT
jgi:hypothetical protein